MIMIHNIVHFLELEIIQIPTKKLVIVRLETQF